MVKWGSSAAALALMCVAVPLAAKDTPKGEAAAASPGLPPAMVALEKSLHPQSGDVRIPEAKAVLHLGDRYYFLPAAEAKRVLVEAWHNPPETGDGVLGLVLAKDTTIFDNVWGAVISYEDTGHVDDADARSQDYGTVLKGMQDGTEQQNADRKQAGYPAMHLVGWAQPPSYDGVNHSLIWARELAVEGDPANGLNYDVRLLGRTGVLSLNMLASMKDIGDVRSAAQSFGRSVSFEPGGGYSDFNASTDKAAEYGLAGLVAGGVAVGVAKKVGLLAIFLKFGKVILLGVAAFGAAAWGAVRKFFGRKDEETI
ncbi:putative membrane-anchored protein [Sphingomonas naasensis]|uniref:DUF2167 domain-containing protein n=1 Tax=Sphingomonas naasensis TaxID=1344951 RepID=A0A4S1WN77_9SPHN|nr:DUF2167 domain-containing protein [Sphingomonas naasensis]NIJ20966.1 putative membrane-anchored protein [Sphingomonas naasensis]TGX43350.1 DUF2167 domain-containing protein [Sphingomonas naasensis]